MTLMELNQKLSLEKLIETGVGLVSEKTYEQIARLVQAQDSAIVPSDMFVAGIRLIKNPFIPDGEIWPYEKYRPETLYKHVQYGFCMIHGMGICPSDCTAEVLNR